jgi:ubiquinone/menaquinone biosynthesis C-methylase UbiE
MAEKYDPRIIEKHFNEAGLNEWERLVKSPRGLVSLYIHTHYLREYIKSGANVLEVGPGPGRFTIELAKLGARISIVDLSAEQLRLNEQKVEEAGFEHAVVWRKKMDIIDLSELQDSTFDATVCYGGPLSYVFDHADKVMEEMLRVTKPGGFVFLGVMSSLGSWQLFIEDVFDLIEEHGLERIQRLFEDGEVIDKLATDSHQCQMYRWSELKSLLSRHQCDIIEVSACAYLSNNLHTEEKLREAMEKPEVWEAFLQWELGFCKEPGAIDAGTHMIVVLKNSK